MFVNIDIFLFFYLLMLNLFSQNFITPLLFLLNQELLKFKIKENKILLISGM